MTIMVMQREHESVKVSLRVMGRVRSRIIMQVRAKVGIKLQEYSGDEGEGALRDEFAF